MNEAIRPISLSIALVGLILSGAVYLLGGAFSGGSAAVGAVIALGNWFVFAWVVSRVTKGRTRNRLGLGMTLGVKMTALMALVSVLISQRLVEPIGFAVGLSAIVVGLCIGSLHYLSNEDSAGVS